MNSNRQEEILLSKVADAFEQYLPPPHDLDRVRQSIRSYLASRIEEIRKDPSVGTSVTRLPRGLRAEYLEAFRANLEANRRYDVLASQIRDQTTPGRGDTTRHSKALIDQHAELSQLQKQNASLVLLRDELESVKLSKRAAALDIGSKVETVSITANAASELSTLSDAITRSIKALELAVVEAQQESEHQKTLLEAAKSQNQEYGKATPQQRAHAMSSTRQALTAWLEENLDKCPAEEASQQRNGIEALQTSPTISDEQIDAQYERYLEARQRLLSAVKALNGPVLDVKPQQATVGDPAKSTSSQLHESTDIGLVNKIEQSLLPALQQQHTSETHLTFAEEQLQKEIATTMSMLDRLSDESQLLPAFPILAHSGRFDHAAATFGKKSAPIEGDDKDELAARIKPWTFAAEAADVSSTGTIEKHLKQGNKAMDSAAKNLAELRVLRQVQSDGP